MRKKSKATSQDATTGRTVAVTESDSPTVHLPSENSGTVFMAFMFIIAAIVVMACWYAGFGTVDIWGIVAAILVGVLAACTIRVANQWESVVIFRMGKYNRTKGPGVYLVIPFIEHVALKADQRVMLTGLGAEETLTLDLVPVNVDAVVFWVVWNPEKACTEVEDYYDAVSMVAQTAMRDAIGRKDISKLVMMRDQLDDELKQAIEEKVADWGISIIDVEIRDLVIPKELQSGMAVGAVAERQSEARMTLAEIEKDIAAMLHEASDIYRNDDIAFKLRQMHLLNESVQKSSGSVVVPSTYAEGFVDHDDQQPNASDKS
jgi:regulator of protease activity HflC (stomatin/prohibitin superfamily)